MSQNKNDSQRIPVFNGDKASEGAPWSLSKRLLVYLVMGGIVVAAACILAKFAFMAAIGAAVVGSLAIGIHIGVNKLSGDKSKRAEPLLGDKNLDKDREIKKEYLHELGKDKQKEATYANDMGKDKNDANQVEKKGIFRAISRKFNFASVKSLKTHKAREISGILVAPKASFSSAVKVMGRTMD